MERLRRRRVVRGGRQPDESGDLGWLPGHPGLRAALRRSIRATKFRLRTRALTGAGGLATRALRETTGLEVIEGEADDLLVAEGRIVAVRLLDGRELGAGAAVLTTGTFLRGLIHIGERQTPAGRVGEAPSIGLSGTLERVGFALGRDRKSVV